jgi:hypothetical protein
VEVLDAERSTPTSASDDPSLIPVMESGASAAQVATPERTWTGLVDDLEGTITGLRDQLVAYDPAGAMSARQRHDLEKALDRYGIATDALARQVDRLLRAVSPRPRR